MRVYPAARYRRRDELLRRAGELEALGHEINSRWIRGAHSASGGLDDPLWAEYAQDDFDDVAAADAVVCFLEPNGGGSEGRHAEFGMALAWGKRVIAVGEPEHLFHILPSVEAYPTRAEGLDTLC